MAIALLVAACLLILIVSNSILCWSARPSDNLYQIDHYRNNGERHGKVRKAL